MIPQEEQKSNAIAERIPQEFANRLEKAGNTGAMRGERRMATILALFGAPIAHEDVPQHAILAGLEIVPVD